MIRKLCYVLAKWLCKINKQPHQKRYLYYYYLQLVILQLFEVALILATSFIFKCIKETILVIIVFIVLRSKLEGFHAHSQNNCIFFSVVILISIAILSKYITIYWYLNSIIITFCFVLFVHTKFGGHLFKQIDKKIKL